MASSRVWTIRFRDLEADFAHGVAEFFPAFGLADDIDIGGQHFDIILFQHPHLGNLDGGIESGLAAQGGQQGVGPFPFNDPGHTFRGDGLDIGGGRRSPGSVMMVAGLELIKNDLIPLFLEGLDRLGPGIVEFAGLTDDDRPGADDKDLFVYLYVWAWYAILPSCQPACSIS
jgi:hypothetical protein